MKIRKYNRTTILWIAALLVAARTATAQKSLNIQDCLDLAVRHNAVLQVADLNRTQSDAKVSEAKSQIWPSLGISGVYTHMGKVTSFSVPLGPGGAMKTFKFGTPENVNVAAKLQMSLFTWGRIGNTVAMAAAGRTLVSVQRKQELLNVTDQVLRAFYAVLLNREVIRVQESGVERSDRQVATAEKRFHAGNASNLELLRAKVQLTNARSALVEAKSNLAKSMLFLAKTLGAEDTAFTVAGTFAREPFEAEEADLIARSLAGRTELAILAAQMGMQKNAIRVAQSGNKPSLYAFSGYTVQNGFNLMEPTKFVENWNAGVQLSIPLFDGFYTRNKTDEARIDLKKTEIQERDFRDFIGMQVRQSLISLKLAEDKMTAQAQNIELSKEALNTAEQQYSNGLISSLDLTDIQQALTQSELLYSQALFNHITTKLDLCKAVGDYHWFESALQNNP
jgi:HAE1 family hydrophobic/amphiphilic exporter-1